MRRAIAALALVTIGYAAGTLAPHASADAGLGEVSRHLAGIHSELTAIRRLMERGR